MLAFPASHVIATSILFYGRIALRTFFCVCRNPIGGLGIILALLQPLLDERAGCRLVVGKRTAETEAVFASAMDRWNDTAEFALFDTTVNGIDALRCWTPL